MFIKLRNFEHQFSAIKASHIMFLKEILELYYSNI